MLRRNPGSDLSLVISAIEIHLEMGGNLAEILEGISTIIRDRVRIKAQVSAYTVQQRLSASVLVGMPFGLGGIIFMANPGYISLLWQTTGGLLMLGLAGGMVAAGAFMLKKISTIDI
jgi:tight adherence protein B